MALEDVARLISPKKPGQIMRLLNCFYKGEAKTIKELGKEAGLSEKMIRYYITKLRYFRLIFYDRYARMYYLDAQSFHSRIDTLLVDALSNLTWTFGHGNRYRPSEVPPQAQGRYYKTMRDETLIPRGQPEPDITATWKNGRWVKQSSAEDSARAGKSGGR